LSSQNILVQGRRIFALKVIHRHGCFFSAWSYPLRLQRLMEMRGGVDNSCSMAFYIYKKEKAIKPAENCETPRQFQSEFRQFQSEKRQKSIVKLSLFVY
jgi:hypothetical protein